MSTSATEDDMQPPIVGKIESKWTGDFLINQDAGHFISFSLKWPS